MGGENILLFLCTQMHVVHMQMYSIYMILKFNGRKVGKNVCNAPWEKCTMNKNNWKHWRGLELWGCVSSDSLSVCQSIYVSVIYLANQLSLYLSIYLSIIYLSFTYLPTYLPIYESVSKEKVKAWIWLNLPDPVISNSDFTLKSFAEVKKTFWALPCRYPFLMSPELSLKDSQGEKPLRWGEAYIMNNSSVTNPCGTSSQRNWYKK